MERQVTGTIRPRVPGVSMGTHLRCLPQPACLYLEVQGQQQPQRCPKNCRPSVGQVFSAGVWKAFRVVSSMWLSHTEALRAFLDTPVGGHGPHFVAVRGCYQVGLCPALVDAARLFPRVATPAQTPAQCVSVPVTPRLRTLTYRSWLLGHPFNDVPIEVFCAFLYRIICPFLVDL